jgi:serine/threonine protein kinase
MIQDAKDRDIEEAELLRDLKHENIAEYFDHFMERDSLYLVTELCNVNIKDYLFFK